MIIPTPEFDPLFAQDGVPFREKMNAYIAREFADLLGPAGTTAAISATQGKAATNGKARRQPSATPGKYRPRGRDAA